MRRTVSLLVSSLVPLAPAADAHAALEGARNVALSFQLPSRNIGCAYASGPAYGAPFLRCDVLSGLRPEPRGVCELAWTGMSLRPTGRARPVCAGDVAFDVNRSRVLAYGRAFARDGLRCLSTRAGLRCTNRSGHGFSLARERWRTV
jgi:hypothetical protein